MMLNAVTAATAAAAATHNIVLALKKKARLKNTTHSYMNIHHID